MHWSPALSILGLLHTSRTSRCEVSPPTFHGLTPSLSSGCCWWLDRTKTSN